MVSTLALFAIATFFIVVANFFLTLLIFDKKEKEMLDNLIKYLEKEKE